MDSPGGNPIRFTLQTSNRVVTIKIAPRATFTALSAEAEVEGLRVGDYAVVRVRHPGHVWIGLHIAFDVRPIPVPNRANWIASVVRETPNDRFLVVQLPSGVTRWVMLDPHTKFRAYGALTSSPPVFDRQELVRIHARRTPHGWIALEIDLLSGGSPQPH